MVTPARSEDAAVTVRVSIGDGEVLTLPLDKYLWRVVAAEMPASFEPEALKAQTVASRTYTLAKMWRTVQNHPDADVCTDINCCQAYIEPDQAAENWGENAQVYTAKIAAAVADTDGVAALYDGAPIQAVFFSSAAGRTVDAVEVWGNAVPYLSGVDSPEGEEVPNYYSTVQVSAADFSAALAGANLGCDLSGPVESWIGEIRYDEVGLSNSVVIGGAEVPTATLRTLFSLRSSSLSLEAAGDTVTFYVTGYGHGVGMSQYGANALASQGKNWQEILTWYYSGTTVENLADKGLDLG